MLQQDDKFGLEISITDHRRITMAQSGSRDWTLTRTEITTEALKRIGQLGIADTASANQLTYGASLQNQILKAWQAPPFGAKLWTYSWQVVDVTSYKFKRSHRF